MKDLPTPLDAAPEQWVRTAIGRIVATGLEVAAGLVAGLGATVAIGEAGVVGDAEAKPAEWAEGTMVPTAGLDGETPLQAHRMSVTANGAVLRSGSTATSGALRRELGQIAAA